MLKRLRLRLREKILHLPPRQVVMETTNRCNLNCPFCLVGRQNELMDKHGSAAHDLMTRAQGTMSPEIFEAVRRNLLDFGIRKAYLHFQGEPFLNPHTPAFAKRLKEDGLEVGIFTNGQAFNEKNIAAIAEAEIDLVRFSVDGASETSYQENRVGGTFAKVRENMARLAEALKDSPTRVEWQFLALRNNEHEIDDARKLAAELGLGFFVKGFRETDPELAPTDPALRSTYLPKPCTDIYHQLGIYWNGDVVPCCYDVDGAEVMGNLTEQSLRDIWRGERYRTFRRAVAEHASRPETEPEICRTCLRWR